MISLIEVSASIKNGESDEQLDAIIEQLIIDQQLDMSVELWRDLNAELSLIPFSIPSVDTLNEALANINSGDAELEALGADQMQEYVSARQAAKARFPVGSYCMVDEVLTLRPTMETFINTNTVAANGVDDFLITGLPVGVQIAVTGPFLDHTEVITDGDFGFGTVVAGVYTIKAELFPYLDQRWEVTFA